MARTPLCWRPLLMGLALLPLVLLMGCRSSGSPAGSSAADGVTSAHRVGHEGSETCALCELYDQRRESVVRILAPGSLGAGIVVSTPGLILTNAHVVGDATLVTLETWAGERVSADVLYVERPVDLALLRAQGRRTWRALDPSHAELPRVGSEVHVLGHPLGLGWTITRGIVSAVRRNSDGTHVLQTDAAVSPGNSGGPLLDGRGRLLGVVTAKAQGNGAENVSFVLPTETAILFLTRALAASRTPEIQP